MCLLFLPPSFPSSRHKTVQRPFKSRQRRPYLFAVDRALWAESLSKTLARPLFTDLSLTLPLGAKVALLGANGSGKSTLLSILAGQLTPDTGKVHLRKGLSLAYVSQELPLTLDTDQTAFSAVLSLAGSHTNSADVNAALQYARTAAEVADLEAEGGDTEVALQKLAKAAVRMEERPSAWVVESYLQTALSRLEIPRERSLREMSGGQKRRVGIAAALVARPDVLLLDEVTNHLSVEGIMFLEEMLQDVGLTVLCISHDRYFVDRVFTNAVWELDDGELFEYGAGYQTFLRDKAARLDKERKEMGELTNAVKKQLEWVRRQPKARSTKARARLEEFDRMDGELRRKKQRAKEAGNMGALVTATSRLGTNVVELEDVMIRRGGKLVVEGLNYRFERGERVGICGGNGVGKSSLIRALVGEVEVEHGVIRVGETVVFGHFEQEGIDVQAGLSETSAMVLGAKSGEDVRVIEYVGELLSLHRSVGGGGAGNGSSGRDKGAKGVKDERQVEAELAARIEELSHSVALPRAGGGRREGEDNPLCKMSAVMLLEQFGFRRDQQHGFVSRLSGGEKRRLQLMGLLLKSPNFLLLDEVSNDLDVNTLLMLEQLLTEYKGVLVLCSHDRFMVDRLVDHLIILEGDGKYRLVEGKFSEYLETKKAGEEEERRRKKGGEASGWSKGAKGEGEGPKGKRRGRKLNFKEKKEYEGLEGEIEGCQRRYDLLMGRVEAEAGRVGYEELAEWSQEMGELETRMEEMTERWMKLAEIAED